MAKHLIKIDGELFEIPLKVYNHLEQQKQRADELEQKLNKEVEESYQMENRWRTEIERADRLEYHIKRMRDNYVLMSGDSKRILKNDTEDKVLKVQINIYDDVAKELNAILEEDGE